MKNPPAMQEVWALSLSGRSPEGNGNHSSTLAWEIPWTEGPGGLYCPWDYKRVGHGLATKQQQQMQILFRVIVLASSDCRNRIPHIFTSHSSGEEGSPGSGCWLIWSHVRACFLNHRWHRLTLFSKRVFCISIIRALIPIMSGPYSWPTLPKDPTS